MLFSKACMHFISMFYSFSDFLHDHCEHQQSERCCTIAAKAFLGSVALSHGAPEIVCHHTDDDCPTFCAFFFFLVSGAWEISLIFRLSGSLISPGFCFSALQLYQTMQSRELRLGEMKKKMYNDNVASSSHRDGDKNRWKTHFFLLL